jgi:putative ABC transport system ATP-binding protein
VSMKPPAIAITNLTFRWRPSDASCLELANATVDAWKSLFLHGPSGSGKSTLLNLIGGVLLPARGSVSLLGQTLGELSASRRDAFRADLLGFIFQQFNLLPYLSVLDNVLLPCRFSARRAKRVSEPESEARRLLAEFDLDPALLGRPAAELSVGQQ